MAEKNIVDAIARGIVVFDGAMGTTLQRMQLANELTVKDFDGRQGCNEVLSLTRPDVVAGVHRGYFEAGVDAVETNTFGASRPKLDEYELGARTQEGNATAARVGAPAARRVPVIAQITLDPSGRMLLGSEPLAAAALLTAAGADIMGLNCSTGPKEMVDPLRALSEGAPLPLSCQPTPASRRIAKAWQC